VAGCRYSPSLRWWGGSGLGIWTFASTISKPTTVTAAVVLKQCPQTSIRQRALVRWVGVNLGVWSSKRPISKPTNESTAVVLEQCPQTSHPQELSWNGHELNVLGEE